MDAQDFAVLGVGHELDEALRVAERPRPAAGRERELAHLDLIAVFARLSLRQADTGDFRVAVGATGDVVPAHGVRVLARQVLDGDDALVHGLVRQARAAHQVANSVDGGDVGLEEVVHRDHVAAPHLDAQRLQPQALGVADVARAQQHDIAFQVGRLAVLADGHAGAGLSRLNLLDAGAQVNLDAPLGQRLLERLPNLGILQRQHLRHHLDNGALGAIGAVDRGELAADGPRAHDEHALGDLGQAHGGLAGDDPLLVHLDAGQDEGPRPRGDDDEARAELACVPVLALHAHRVGVGDGRRALDQFRIILLKQVLQALARLADHAVRALHAGGPIHCDVLDLNPELLRLANQFQHLGVAEQGLSRDAAPVGAHAAHVALLDTRHAQAQLARAE